MTNAGPIIFIIISLGIGYVVEPIFIADTKKPSKESESVSGSGEREILSPDVQLDLSKITAEDFPEKVLLKAPLNIEDPGGITMNLKKGSEVKPLRLEGDQLIVQPVKFPIEGKLHVDQTNFKLLAVQMIKKRMIAKNSMPKDDPVIETDPADDTMNQVVAKPVEEPKTMEDAEPVEEPEAIKEIKKMDSAGIVEIMKSSVADGKVTEFEAAQVTSWKGGSEIELDGESYQSGHVIFKAETILGVQENEAIALIKAGSVVKWLWAKTKLEMQ